MRKMLQLQAEWRNGRRWGLKIPCPIGRVGSTPTSANVSKTAQDRPAEAANWLYRSVVVPEL